MTQQLQTPRSTLMVAALLVAPLLTVLALNTHALAQQQTTDQQKCLTTMNKNGAKVAKTRAKLNASCIKLEGQGRLAPQTVTDCLNADPKGKLQRAKDKVTDGQADACVVDIPNFGFTDADTVNGAAVEEEISLAENVFGMPPVIDSTDSVLIQCQSKVAKEYDKLAAKWLKAFNTCKKKGLKSGTVTNEADLVPCIDGDPKGKILKARQKLLRKIDQLCPGVDLRIAAFPGCAIPTPPDATVGECVAAEVACRRWSRSSTATRCLTRTGSRWKQASGTSIASSTHSCSRATSTARFTPT